MLFKRYGIFFSIFLFLFSFPINDNALAACNRYSDADDCAGSNSFMGSLITLLFVFGIVFYMMYWSKKQEEKGNEKEEYWNNLDKMMEEIREDDKRNALKNLGNNSQNNLKEIVKNYYLKDRQKPLSFPCPECNQILKSKVEVGKKYLVVCPKCNYQWAFHVLNAIDEI